MIYGSSENKDGNTVSAKIAILDTNGTEISVVERSWQGSYLSMEFASLSLNGKNYFFPYLVKGTESVIERESIFRKKRGTFLYPYFIENYSCLLFSSDDEDVQKNLYKIAQSAKNPFAVYFTKFSRRFVVNLSMCESGVYYGIFTDSDGKLSVRKE